MELHQAKGNTWYLADWQLIPFYKIDDTHCILLDSGLISQREAMEEVFRENHLIPVGILGSHAHTDHSPNHHYFKEKYGIPVALSFGEAAISRNPLMLKAYYYMLSEQQLLSFPEYREMLVDVDRIIMPDEERITFCGVTFDILHTPGHSPDHIAIGTPDGVLYLGDAVISNVSLTESKLPYFFSLETAFDTFRKLENVDYSIYITAHRGTHGEIASLIEQNKTVLQGVADHICRLINRPMTISEAIHATCEELSLLSARVRRSTYYERNIRTYLEYLVDTGKLEALAERGVTMLTPAKCDG